MTDDRTIQRSATTQECCSGLSRLLAPELFKALCDPNRIAILIRLAERGQPSSVSEVAACCPINLSVVSRHLTTLRDAGIVVAQKKGRHVFYSVSTQQLARTLRSIADALETCCPAPCACEAKTTNPTPTTHEEQDDAQRKA